MSYCGVNQVAEILGVDPDTIRKRLQRKQWDCLPQGGFKTSPRPQSEWRWPRENVLTFRKNLEGSIKDKK